MGSLGAFAERWHSKCRISHATQQRQECTRIRPVSNIEARVWKTEIRNAIGASNQQPTNDWKRATPLREGCVPLPLRSMRYIEANSTHAKKPILVGKNQCWSTTFSSTIALDTSTLVPRPQTSDPQICVFRCLSRPQTSFGLCVGMVVVSETMIQPELLAPRDCPAQFGPLSRSTVRTPVPPFHLPHPSS